MLSAGGVSRAFFCVDVLDSLFHLNLLIDSPSCGLAVSIAGIAVWGGVQPWWGSLMTFTENHDDGIDLFLLRSCVRNFECGQSERGGGIWVGTLSPGRSS